MGDKIELTTTDINGEQYVRKTDIPEQVGPPTLHRIVVADRGWVFVGATTDNADGSVTIANARCIRYWGTSNDQPGLGHLALNGPTSKTKLDPSGTVRIPSHSVITAFDTDGAKWA